MSDESYWNSQANQYHQQSQDAWNGGDNWAYHEAQNRAAEARRQADEARAHQERMNASQTWQSGASTTFNTSTTPTGGGYSGEHGGGGGDGPGFFATIADLIAGAVKYSFLALLWVGLPLVVLGEIASQFTVSHQQDLKKYVSRHELLTQEIIRSSPRLQFRDKTPFDFDQYATDATKANVKKLSNESLSSLVQLYVSEDKKKKSDAELKRAAVLLIGNRVKENPNALTASQIQQLQRGNFGSFLFTPRMQKEAVAVAADYIVFAQLGLISPNYGESSGLKWYGDNWAHIDHAYVLLAKNPGFEDELKVVQDAYQKAKIKLPHYSSLTNFYSVSDGICLLGFCADPKAFELHIIPGLLSSLGK